jgi:hypothetical protein
MNQYLFTYLLKGENREARLTSNVIPLKTIVVGKNKREAQAKFFLPFIMAGDVGKLSHLTQRKMI